MVVAGVVPLLTDLQVVQDDAGDVHVDLRELLEASRLDREPALSDRDDGLLVQPKAADSMNALMRNIETQILKHLFKETDGDFKKMAAKLLKGDPGANERRIRLRFNQLGLRVRSLKKRKIP